MIIVEPIQITDGNLTSSTIPDIDWPQASESTYNIYKTSIYELSNELLGASQYYGNSLMGARNNVVYELSQDLVEWEFQESTLFTHDFSESVIGTALNPINGQVGVVDTNGRFVTYDETFTLIYNTTVSNSKSLCAHLDGFLILTNSGGGGVNRYLFYRNGSHVQTFSTTNTDTPKSISVKDDIVYIAMVNGDIKLFNLFEDNATEVDSKTIALPTDVFLESFFYVESQGKFARITTDASTIPEIINIERFSSGIDVSPVFYEVGDESIGLTTNNIYKCSSDYTLDSPEIGVTKDPQTWVSVKPTNKFAMFDYGISTQSESDSTITIVLDPEQSITAVCLFGLSCTTVNVTVTGGVGFSSGDVDVTGKKKYAAFDIDTNSTPTITIVISGLVDGFVKVGEVVIGTQEEIGTANYGGDLNLVDYSRKVTDEFGNIETEKRRNVKNIAYPVTISTANLSDVYERIAELTTVPVVYSGSTQDDATLIFGIYQSFRANVTAPSVSNYTLTAQGLV